MTAKKLAHRVRRIITLSWCKLLPRFRLHVPTPPKSEPFLIHKWLLQRFEMNLFRVFSPCPPSLMCTIPRCMQHLIHSGLASLLDSWYCS